MILLNCNPARYYAIMFLLFLFTSDVDPVQGQKPDPRALYLGRREIFQILLNILDSYKSLLYCFKSLGVKTSSVTPRALDPGLFSDLGQ